MRVLVLGDGLLARSIRDEANEFPDADIIVAGHDEVDILSFDSLVALYRRTDPEVVINTVAMHNLGACEARPSDAFDLNARAAERVARLAPTVYISTDNVFHDGGPHDESMPGAQPKSVYGRSKLAGELNTLEQGGSVVRVSALFGHHLSHKGPSFPDIIAANYGPLELPKDQVFSPTYAPDAAHRILAIALWEKSGIYHAANAGSTDWATFGAFIRDTLGRRWPKIKPVVRHDPIRPRNSSLRSTKFPPLRHYALAVADWAHRRQDGIVANRVSPLREGAE